MAALTITASNVGVTSATAVDAVKLTVGQATSHGQLLYRDSTDGLYKLADADAEASSKATHMAITSASTSGDTVLAVSGGDVTLGSILTTGTDYYVHTTAGSIGVRGDLSAGDYVRRVGIAKSSSVLYLEFSDISVLI